MELKNSWLEKVSLVFLFLIPFIPLLSSQLTLYASIYDKLFLFNLLVELALISGLLFVVSNPTTPPLKLTLTDLAVILLGLVLVLATVFSADPAGSFWGSFYRTDSLLAWLHYLTFYFLLRHFFNPQIWLYWLRTNVVVAGILSLLIGWFVVKTGILSGNWSLLVAGPLGNPNFLAYYLALALILTIGLLLLTRLGSWHWLYGSSALLQLIALWFTSGRTAYLAVALAATLLLAWVLFKQKNILLKRAVWLLPILMFIFVLTASNLQTGRLSLKLHSPALGNRLAAWQIGFEAWKKKPLLGYGPENFALAFNQEYQPFFEEDLGSENETWFDKAHNFVVEYLVTTGLLGLVAFILLLLFSLRAAYFNLKKRQATYSSLALAGLVGVLVLNSSGFDIVTSTMLFVAFLALLNIQADLFFKWQNRRLLNLVGWSVIFLAFLACFYSFKPWLVQRAAAWELKEINHETLKEEVGHLKSLMDRSLFVRRSFLPYTMEALYCKEIRLANFKEPKEQAQLWLALANLADNYREDLATQARTLNIVGTSYSIAAGYLPDASKKAKEYFLAALEKSSNRPYLYRNLGQLALENNKLSEAENYFDQMLQLSPRLKETQFWLAMVKLKQGETEKAYQILEPARRLLKAKDFASIFIRVHQKLGLEDNLKAFKEELPIDLS